MRFKNLTQAEQAAIAAALTVQPDGTFSEAYLKRHNNKHGGEAFKDAIVRNMRERAKQEKRAERLAKATERRAAKEARHLAYAERCRKARAKRLEILAKRRERRIHRSRQYIQGVASRPRLTVAAMEWLAEHGFDDPAEYNDGFSGLREREATEFACERSMEVEEADTEDVEAEVDWSQFDQTIELTEAEKILRRAEIAKWNGITRRNLGMWWEDYHNFRLNRPVVVHNCHLAQRPPTVKVAEKPPVTIVKEPVAEPPAAPTVINVNVVINVTNVTQVITPAAETSPWEKIEEAKNLEVIVAALEEHGFRFGLVKPKSVAELRRKLEATPKWGSRPMEVIASTLAAYH